MTTDESKAAVAQDRLEWHLRGAAKALEWAAGVALDAGKPAWLLAALEQELIELQWLMGAATGALEPSTGVEQGVTRSEPV